MPTRPSLCTLPTLINLLEMNDPHSAFREHYPSWPWVRLGSCFADQNDDIQIDDAATEYRLKHLVDQGRFLVQPLLNSDIDGFERIMRDAWRQGIDRSGNRHQNVPGCYGDLLRSWSVDDVTLRTNIDNRGLVTHDSEGRDFDINNDRVDRSFDGI